jgi:hypothetical protein
MSVRDQRWELRRKQYMSSRYDDEEDDNDSYRNSRRPRRRDDYSDDESEYQSSYRSSVYEKKSPESRMFPARRFNLVTSSWDR